MILSVLNGEYDAFDLIKPKLHVCFRDETGFYTRKMSVKQYLIFKWGIYLKYIRFSYSGICQKLLIFKLNVYENEVTNYNLV